jgi:MFS transporter, DHA1 family, multidrug resistance protein
VPIDRRRTVVLLAALTAMAPFSTDVYLPLLPGLALDLGVSQTSAQGTLSAVLLGVAVGQLVSGPLGDAVGRRRPVLVGTSLFVVTCLAGAAAPNVGTLVVLRFVSGLAVAGAVVTARAVVSDVRSGVEAARTYATLSSVFALAPVVAPLIGGALSPWLSWRGIFVVMGGIGVVLTVWSWRGLPETLPPDARHPMGLRSTGAVMAGLLRARRFQAYLVSFAAVGGLLFAYLAASGFVLQERFGLSPVQYAVAFAANAFGLFISSNVSRRLVAQQGPARLLAVGQGLGAVGAGVLALGIATSSLPVVLLGFFLAVGTLGLVLPNATALGMAASAPRAGTGAGLLGIGQFALGSVAAALSGLGGSPWSLVAVMGFCAVAGPAARWMLLRSAEAG